MTVPSDRTETLHWWIALVCRLYSKPHEADIRAAAVVGAFFRAGAA